jgi:heat shock protein HslJ
MKLPPFLRAAIMTVPILAGCAGAAVKREEMPLPFVGTRWMLVTERVPSGEAPFLEFGDGAVTGSSGCNRIMGRYLQDAVGAGAIVFSSIASSKRLCDDASMAIEERLLGVLRSSTSVVVTGDLLHIDGSSGRLVFRAATPAKESAAPRY